MIRRAYSIASSANERDHLEFMVVHVTGGRLTDRLWPIHPGERMFMDEHIHGDFTMEGVPNGRTLVMISTGTGLAPYMSMLRTYRGTNRWRRLILIHGVRYAADLGYRSYLERIAEEETGVVVLLRDQETSRDFMDAVEALGEHRDELEDRRSGDSVLRTYGVGAQILRDLGLSKIRVLSAPKQMYAISGFDLEITEYV